MLTLGASFHVPSICLSLFSWSSLYFALRRLEPWRKAEWHCRTVTALHAALVTVMTAWACFVQGPWPFTDAGGPNTPLQVTTSIVCLGYFIFDFTWSLYFQTEGLAMLLHHSLSIFGFVWMLYAGKYGTELMATVCGSEVTNPLLQLRWFLRETGRYHTVVGEVVDIVFMLSFFAIRLGVGSVLILCYFQQPTDFMGRFGALAIYLISWTFAVSIFQYAVRKYTKKYRAWRQQQHQQKSSSFVGSGLLPKDQHHPSTSKSVGDSGASLAEGLGSCPSACVSENGVKSGNVPSKSENETVFQELKNQSSPLPQKEGSDSDGTSCSTVNGGPLESTGGEDRASSSHSQDGLRHRGVVSVSDDSAGVSSPDTVLTDKAVANGVLVNG